jgi:hypothetical protein
MFLGTRGPLSPNLRPDLLLLGSAFPTYVKIPMPGKTDPSTDGLVSAPPSTPCPLPITHNRT